MCMYLSVVTSTLNLPLVRCGGSAWNTRVSHIQLVVMAVTYMFMLLARIKTLLLWFGVTLYSSLVTACIFLYSYNDWDGYCIDCVLCFHYLAAFEHALFLTWMCLQLENYAWWQKRLFKCECLGPYHSVWLLISLTSCCIWIDRFIPAIIACWRSCNRLPHGV